MSKQSVTNYPTSCARCVRKTQNNGGGRSFKNVGIRLQVVMMPCSCKGRRFLNQKGELQSVEVLSKTFKVVSVGRILKQSMEKRSNWSLLKLYIQKLTSILIMYSFIIHYLLIHKDIRVRFSKSYEFIYLSINVSFKLNICKLNTEFTNLIYNWCRLMHANISFKSS